jgi:hypothetical protein
MSEAKIDISAFENFISQTLQPRLEELLTERDAMVKIKGDYDQTRTSLGGLQASRNGMLAKVETLRGVNDHAGDAKVVADTITSLLTEPVHSLVPVGQGFSVHAVSNESLDALTVTVVGVDGTLSKLPLAGALTFCDAQLQTVLRSMNDVDSQISDVVSDIENCLSSVQQLKKIQGER